MMKVSKMLLEMKVDAGVKVEVFGIHRVENYSHMDDIAYLPYFKLRTS